MKTILQATDDPNLFAPWFKNATWAAWRGWLAALFGLTMTAEQLALFRECTGRSVAPTAPAREGWLVCGRRAGKSFVLALVAVYLACFHDYRKYLAPGERATILILAADRKQSRVIFRYIAALLKQVPMLALLIENERAESFDLNTRVTIEVGTCSYRTVRGYTFAAVLCDELAFWRSDDSANPDDEIISAVRPGMLTIPNAMLLCASSPYARRGALWDAHQTYFGKDDPEVLVWQAATTAMNPTVPQSYIDKKLEEDPHDAGAEYLAQFRTDVEAFLTLEAIRACVEPGVFERLYDRRHVYFAFVDMSGGSSDSSVIVVAHVEGSRIVIDCIRERRSPHSPEQVVGEFADTLKRYRVSKVTGDNYAGEWPKDAFRKHGISYDVSDKRKSAMYLSVLPLINSSQVTFLDSDRMVSQFVGLERKTQWGGKDSIDHAPGGHDDVANAVAGVASLANRGSDLWSRLVDAALTDAVKPAWPVPKKEPTDGNN
jgi:hypothetical protein